MGHESGPGLAPVGEMRIGLAEDGEVAADFADASLIAVVIARLLVLASIEESKRGIRDVRQSSPTRQALSGVVIEWKHA